MSDQPFPVGYPRHLATQQKVAFAREYKHYLNKFYNPRSDAWNAPDHDGYETGSKWLGRGAMGVAAGAGVLALGLKAGVGGAVAHGARHAVPYAMQAGRGLIGRGVGIGQNLASRGAGIGQNIMSRGTSMGRNMFGRGTNIGRSTANTAQSTAQQAAPQAAARGMGGKIWQGAKSIGTQAAIHGGVMVGADMLMGGGGGGGGGYDDGPTGYPPGMGGYDSNSPYAITNNALSRTSSLNNAGGLGYLPRNRTPGAFL